MNNSKFYHAGKVRMYTIKNTVNGFCYEVGADWQPMTHNEACAVISKQVKPSDWVLVELKLSEVFIPDSLETLYLSYANDFISIAAFTEYHGIESEVIAHSIIARGRVIHQSRNPAARNWFTLNQTSKNRNLWDLRLLAEKSA